MEKVVFVALLYAVLGTCACGGQLDTTADIEPEACSELLPIIYGRSLEGMQLFDIAIEGGAQSANYLYGHLLIADPYAGYHNELGHMLRSPDKPDLLVYYSDRYAGQSVLAEIIAKAGGKMEGDAYMHGAVVGSAQFHFIPGPKCQVWNILIKPKYP